MTEAEKAEFVAMGRAIERVKRFDGGAEAIVQIMVAIADHAGLAIVPKNPTAAMLRAPRGDGWPEHGTHCDTCACLTFDAMVEAGESTCPC